MAIDAVIQQVERAFPEAPLPETTLRQAQLADQSMSREISQSEWDAAGTLDRGVHWKDIPDDTLIGSLLAGCARDAVKGDIDVAVAMSKWMTSSRAPSFVYSAIAGSSP